MLTTQALFGDIVRNMLGKLAFFGLVIAALLLVVFLQTTVPATVGPLGILVVFILIYVLVLGVLTLLLFGGSKIISKVSTPLIAKKPIRPLTLRRSYYFSSVIALAPVMFLGMQSVGEVGIYDVILVVLFVMIACIYIVKRTA